MFCKSFVCYRRRADEQRFENVDIHVLSVDKRDQGVVAGKSHNERRLVDRHVEIWIV